MNIITPRYKNTTTFAEQAAAAELGPHYVMPSDRNFRDRLPPNWKRLGDVAGQVLQNTAARTSLENAFPAPQKSEAANFD